MRIIFLFGPSSCGKTTTLNLLYDQLIQNGSNVLRAKTRLGGCVDDFETVLLYNNKKIAIFTMGDFATEVMHAMSFYEGMGCDTLICACNDRFVQPIYRLKNRYANQYSIIKKTISPNHIAANQADVATIISQI